jgi:CheY-like chemotaxis protein
MSTFTLTPRCKSAIIIDDTEIDQFISKKILQVAGFAEKVICYGSALDALRFLETNSTNIEMLPEIIFLDIRMPVMDGFGFLEVFEKLPESVHHQCTILMLSSSLDPQDVKRANSNRFVYKFLNKPLSVEQLNLLNLTNLR